MIFSILEENFLEQLQIVPHLLFGTGSSVVSAEVTGVGTNYSGTISNVGTYNITGQGSGLRLTLTPSGGGLGSGTVTIVSHGNGYQTGDVVGIVTADTGEGTGRDGTIYHY